MAFDEGLADRVRMVVSRKRGISERRMFGGLAFMMNGHMFCGVLKTDLMLRLGPDASTAALKQQHTRLMDFSGKPMKSMIYVDAAGVDSESDLQRWVEACLAFVQSLPPKK